LKRKKKKKKTKPNLQPSQHPQPIYCFGPSRPASASLLSLSHPLTCGAHTSGASSSSGAAPPSSPAPPPAIPHSGAAPSFSPRPSAFAINAPLHLPHRTHPFPYRNGPHRAEPPPPLMAGRRAPNPPPPRLSPSPFRAIKGTAPSPLHPAPLPFPPRSPQRRRHRAPPPPLAPAAGLLSLVLPLALRPSGKIPHLLLFFSMRVLTVLAHRSSLLGAAGEPAGKAPPPVISPPPPLCLQATLAARSEPMAQMCSSRPSQIQPYRSTRVAPDILQKSPCFFINYMPALPPHKTLSIKS
jgi:hypothetical protein